MFDRDGDGKISITEFRTVMSGLAEKLTDSDFDRMIRDADADCDGFISQAEFARLMLPQEKLVCGRFTTNEQKTGETRVLRNTNNAELRDNFRGMHTLKEIIEFNVKECPDKPFVGTREKLFGDNGVVTYGDYKWKTYAQVYEISEAVARYLYKHELCPKLQTEEGAFRFLTLYAKNREEWCATDIATAISGITSVTLYDTLG
jgi:hypothetical protein